VEIEKNLDDNNFILQSVTHLLVPQLKWSARQLLSQMKQANKLMLVGKCVHKFKEKSFLMIFNTKSGQAEVIKILDTHAQVTCLSYGPFDNGHVLLGLEDGQLLAYDYPQLQLQERT